VIALAAVVCLTWERCVTVIASAAVVCVAVSPGKGVSL